LAMKSLSRRDVLKLAPAVLAVGSEALAAEGQYQTTPVWKMFELSLPGPRDGNPFVEVQLTAVFSQGHREVAVDGFYDGEGRYKIRFMPDTPGVWRYRTASGAKPLDGHEGGFEAVAPAGHGPVRVANTHHFAYADGTAFFPFGTTCYAWVHQSEALQEQTLATLKTAPFNKIRMCVFPKHYEYNHNEPPFYPFPRDAEGKNDFTRFNPEFFAHLERRIGDLRGLGIEADLILFHPYDRWGYATMTAEQDDRYLKYVLARLSAYPNIWWSMANEFDLMKAKSASDFDRLFHIVEQHDPYAHLRSIHYSKVTYDYARPWVTHGCMQSAKFDQAVRYIDDWRKPVLFDEVQYEGNLNRRWGNISGEEMARRFWLGVIAGCYVTHGETLLDADAAMDEEGTPTLWWSHGGALKGTSPAMIALLRKLVEESAGPGMKAGLEAQASAYYLNATAYAADGKTAKTILYFFDDHQPIWYEFPLPAGTFTAEAIDPVAMTMTALAGTYTGKARIRLSGKPFRAMRFRAAG
jgi:Domain of unknown function (DUF5060)/Protein of unknown function (DUF4038)/Domain of unknown function (DUF5605)